MGFVQTNQSIAANGTELTERRRRSPGPKHSANPVPSLLYNLPAELLLSVFLWLDIGDILVLSAVSKRLLHEANSQIIWRALVSQYYGIPPTIDQLYVEDGALHSMRIKKVEESLGKLLAEYLPAEHTSSLLHFDNPQEYFSKEIGQFLEAVKKRLKQTLRTHELMKLPAPTPAAVATKDRSIRKKRSKSMLIDSPNKLQEELEAMSSAEKSSERSSAMSSPLRSSRAHHRKKTSDSKSIHSINHIRKQLAARQQPGDEDDWKRKFQEYHSFLRKPSEPEEGLTTSSSSSSSGSSSSKSTGSAGSQSQARGGASPRRSPRPLAPAMILSNPMMQLEGFGDGDGPWPSKTPEPEHVTELELVGTLKSHSDTCWTVIPLGKDTNLVATSSEDMTVKIWDLSEKRLIQTLVGHTAPVYSLAVLDKDVGQVLASGSADGNIRIWDWAKPQPLVASIDAHHSDVEALAVIDSPFESVVVDTRKAKKDRRSLIRTLSASPSQIITGKILVSASSDDKIKLWSVETKKCLCSISADSGGVSCITVINSHTIASVGMDAIVKVWSFASNYSTATLQQTMPGHTNLVVSLSTVTFPIASSDVKRISPREPLVGLWVVSASCDGTIRCWDVSKGFCMRSLSDHDGGQVGTMRVVPGVYPVIASSHRNTPRRTIKTWNPRTSQRIRTFVGLADSGEINAFTVLREYLVTTTEESSDLFIYKLK